MGNGAPLSKRIPIPVVTVDDLVEYRREREQMAS